jgi:hypothetical protein
MGTNREAWLMSSRTELGYIMDKKEENHYLVSKLNLMTSLPG